MNCRTNRLTPQSQGQQEAKKKEEVSARPDMQGQSKVATILRFSLVASSRASRCSSASKVPSVSANALRLAPFLRCCSITEQWEGQDQLRRPALRGQPALSLPTGSGHGGGQQRVQRHLSGVSTIASLHGVPSGGARPRRGALNMVACTLQCCACRARQFARGAFRALERKNAGWRVRRDAKVLCPIWTPRARQSVRSAPTLQLAAASRSGSPLSTPGGVRPPRRGGGRGRRALHSPGAWLRRGGGGAWNADAQRGWLEPVLTRTV